VLSPRLKILIVGDSLSRAGHVRKPAPREGAHYETSGSQTRVRMVIKGNQAESGFQVSKKVMERSFGNIG
jgi:hypothetical protein